MKTHIIMFAVLVTLQAVIVNTIVNKTYASGSPPPTTIVNNSIGYGAGTAIAAASGTCVKDWNLGWQKCVSWAMIDPEGEDPVHGFGGGLTTRLDQFAIHFYAGVEDLEGDNTTILFTGSVNWR